jgi:hypothetical protein
MLGIQTFINADGNRTRDTIRSQLFGTKSEEQRQEDRKDTGNQGEHMKTALWVASLGAAPACLRESTN